MRVFPFLLLSLALFLAGHARAAPPVLTVPPHARETLAKFLGEIPAVRVQMVASPGNGHQAAGLRMIQRLRELGFKGRVQVIYDDVNSRHAVGPKLKILVPGFDETNKGPQQIHSKYLGEVEFIGASVADASIKAEKMSLGLSAAADEHLGAGHNSFLNVENFVQLQPRRWSLRAATREIRIGNEEPISLQHLWNLGAAVRAEKVGDWDEFLTKELAAIDGAAPTSIAQKLPGLRAMMKESAHAELLPAYAIDVEKHADQVMSEVMKGLKRAMAENAAEFTKPVIVPIMTEWKTPEERAALEAAMAKLGISSVDLGAPDLATKLKALKGGDILMVQVGQLPPAVFDAIFTHATLPPLLAGRNLANLLVNEGIPFLNIMGETKDIGSEIFALGLPREAGDLTLGAHAAFGRQRYQNPTFENANNKALADYYAAAHREDGVVRALFRALRPKPEAPEQDLVAMGLLELQKQIAGREDGSILPKVSFPPGALRNAPCPAKFNRLGRGGGRAYAP